MLSSWITKFIFIEVVSSITAVSKWNFNCQRKYSIEYRGNSRDILWGVNIRGQCSLQSMNFSIPTSLNEITVFQMKNILVTESDFLQLVNQQIFFSVLVFIHNHQINMAAKCRNHCNVLHHLAVHTYSTTSMSWASSKSESWYRQVRTIHNTSKSYTK